MKIFCVLLLFCYLSIAEDPSIFKDFLVNMLFPCAPQMPLSYFVSPRDYFENVPLDQRVAPPQRATSEQNIPECGDQPVSIENLDNYTFQTERLTTQYGLDLYDGAVWMIALSYLGSHELVWSYYYGVLGDARTCELQSILGNAPCKGLVVTGNCTGDCGFCYGDSSSPSLTGHDAWYFKSISPIYSLDSEPDARCPEFHNWSWNSWAPVLGENSWTKLIGPLQSEWLRSGGDINNISIEIIDDSIEYLVSLQMMQIPELGAIYYAPHNTYNVDTTQGSEISTENQASTLAGLSILRQMLQLKNYRTDQIPTISTLMEGIIKYLKAAFYENGNYFINGGRWNWITKKINWFQDFAVDCQTWTTSVLGEKLIDSWFGTGTTAKIWKVTLQFGGYQYDSMNNVASGVGFSINTQAQVFSGEWTFGTVNMLRILANETQDPDLQSSCMKNSLFMRNATSDMLTNSFLLNNTTVTAVMYANTRYYIPFGWWSNPLPSTSSSAWAVLVDGNYNPFYLGGDYHSCPL